MVHDNGIMLNESLICYASSYGEVVVTQCNFWHSFYFESFANFFVILRQRWSCGYLNPLTTLFVGAFYGANAAAAAGGGGVLISR